MFWRRSNPRSYLEEIHQKTRKMEFKTYVPGNEHDCEVMSLPLSTAEINENPMDVLEVFLIMFKMAPTYEVIDALCCKKMSICLLSIKGEGSWFGLGVGGSIEECKRAAARDLLIKLLIRDHKVLITKKLYSAYEGKQRKCLMVKRITAMMIALQCVTHVKTEEKLFFCCEEARNRHRMEGSFDETGHAPTIRKLNLSEENKPLDKQKFVQAVTWKIQEAIKTKSKEEDQWQTSMELKDAYFDEFDCAPKDISIVKLREAQALDEKIKKKMEIQGTLENVQQRLMILCNHRGLAIPYYTEGSVNFEEYSDTSIEYFVHCQVGKYSTLVRNRNRKSAAELATTKMLEVLDERKGFI